MATQARTTIETTPSIDGLRVRGFGDSSDYRAIADLIEVSHRADGDGYLPDAEGVRYDLERYGGFDPIHDLLFAEVDGRLVGYGAAQRQDREDAAIYVTLGTVHPDYRHRGLGREILHRNEARLREIRAEHDDPRGREFAAFIGDREKGARELLESEGYRPVRYYRTMLRSGLDHLPEVAVPEGLELRPLEPERHRAVFDASNEAFRDHWDHREATDADFVAFFKMADLRPDLCRIAWDRDQVAGSVLTFVWKNENAKLGVQRAWFEKISVRRPWRRRGVAKAMIVSAMAAARDAGLDATLLGVDAENPTGALGLYESLGFTVDDSGTAFRKPWSE